MPYSEPVLAGQPKRRSLDAECAAASAAGAARPRRETVTTGAGRHLPEFRPRHGKTLASRALKLGRSLACLVSFLMAPLVAEQGAALDLTAKYDNLLLLQSGDYDKSPTARAEFREILLPKFRKAMRDVVRFPFARRGEFAYFVGDLDNGRRETAAQRRARTAANGNFHRLFSVILPTLAYAYRTPGSKDAVNPYYRNRDVAYHCLAILDYAYSRGLTEHAWLPDHAGTASSRAIREGWERTSGDFSEVSLRLAGYIQAVFLLRDVLREADLLEKYRAVARNLVVNNGTMRGAFFMLARGEGGVRHGSMPVASQYYLNADGARLFVDYFLPYYLLIDDAAERSRMTAVLRRVIARNVTLTPGIQGTIKPDGTGFHHGGAYVGAYSPFALEAYVRLLYMLKGTSLYQAENVAAVKLGLETYRVMVQQYIPAAALRGRLIGSDGDGISAAVSKAMLFLAHPDGLDDAGMRARFGEFFDAEFFFSGERRKRFHEGARGVDIHGLGIYRLVADLQGQAAAAAEVPSGAWIKPYAAAGFFRRENWLATAKGFSQYFWDYEGALDRRQNSFGQNWAHGSLTVFSAGTPVSERASGYAFSAGWDWYHVPGTTASHYPIEARNQRALRAERRRQGIQQRDDHRNYNSRTFVGGVSLGGHGFFAQDLEALPFIAPTDLRARKSYFFFGDKILALGSHITGGTARDETHTTLFQTYISGAAPSTRVNGRRLDGLNTELAYPAGSVVAMTDSVGNSYYLTSSTAELLVSRKLQSSMTESYDASQGPYATAYLNHGVKPKGDSYEYVVIPADRDAAKLERLAAAPADFYEVLDSGSAHLVRFPRQNMTAYAFYEVTETPGELLIRTVDRPAAVIVQEQADGAEEGAGRDAAAKTVRLAASVPDIGWEFEDDILSRGLSYARIRFAYQRAKQHTLRLTLRGTWCPDKATLPIGARSVLQRGETLLMLPCQDGLGTEVLLEPCGMVQ